MSLQHYRIDLKKLPTEEREKLYDILEKQSFLISIDFKNIGLYEVFWGFSKPMTEVIQFPPEAIITHL